MTQDFSSLRTTEDIINALSVLYFNLNEIERIYYDMFLNTTPMDVTFQRYNDLGVLEDITLPNRAKDTKSALSGSGNPNGTVSASSGTFYIDVSNYDLYFKSSGSDSYGWVKVWSSLNLVEGTNFLSPTGSGAQLTDLNMSNASVGTLGVARGGTGVNAITGLVKGNGTSAFSAAVDGVDYLGVNGSVGIVCYYPVAKLPDGVTSAIPSGWLICDGSAYSRTTYSRLFAKIGATYGTGNGSTTFNIPNLMDDGNGNPFFIRCWDGSTAFNTVQQDQVGVHTHPLSGNTGEESAHTHTRGTMNITGNFRNGAGLDSQVDGAMYYIDSHNIDYRTRTDGGSDSNYTNSWCGFDASRSWTGTTSGGSAHSHSLSGLSTGNNSTGTSSNETRVLNKMMVPIIKY